MPTRRIILPFLHAIILMVCAQRAIGGDYSFPHASIEWMVTDSELIARCRLIEAASDPTGKWTRATFDLTEVLKGEPLQQVTVFTRSDLFARKLAIPLHEEQIMFFQQTSFDAAGPNAKGSIYPYKPNADWIIDLDQAHRNEQKVLARTADLRELTSMPEVEEAIKTAIASNAQPINPWPRRFGKFFGLWRTRAAGPIGVTIPFMRGSKYAGLHLIVPLDSRIASMPYAESFDVIQFIESKRNIELLKEELNKDSFSRLSRDGDFWSVSSYKRWDAYRSLQAWGVEVKRPAIDVPDDLYIVVTWWSVIASTLLVLLSLTLVSRVARRRLDARRRTFRIAFFDALTLVSVMLALLVAFQWIEGDRVNDAIFANSSARFMARLSNNSLNLYRTTPWPKPIPLSVACYKSPELFKKHLTLRTEISSIKRSAIGFKWIKTTQGASWPTSFALTIPAWSLLILFMLLPGSRALNGLWRGMRARRKSRAGLCRKCGYDLRAGHDRCPECGSISTVPRSTTLGRV